MFIKVVDFRNSCQLEMNASKTFFLRIFKNINKNNFSG